MFGDQWTAADLKVHVWSCSCEDVASGVGSLSKVRLIPCWFTGTAVKSTSRSRPSLCFTGALRLMWSTTAYSRTPGFLSPNIWSITANVFLISITLPLFEALKQDTGFWVGGCVLKRLLLKSFGMRRGKVYCELELCVVILSAWCYDWQKPVYSKKMFIALTHGENHLKSPTTGSHACKVKKHFHCLIICIYFPVPAPPGPCIQLDAFIIKSF